MKAPTQCALWKKENITPTDLNLQILEVFSRENRRERDLLKCRECGQLYFHEWYEHVNFSHDAFMYETYIPVENTDEVEPLLAVTASNELNQFVPQLHGSFTNEADAALNWVTEKKSIL